MKNSSSSRVLRRGWTMAALALVACGPTVEIDSHGSGGGESTSPTSGGGGAASTTTGAGATAGSGAGAAPACEPGLPPYAGPLCGPSSSPCKVLADEDLGEGAGNNDAPAVAVGPDCQAHVVFAANTPDYEGIYADRLGPNDWKKTVLPGPSALAGHVIASDGTAYLLTYDGAMNTTLRSRAPGGDWQSLGPLPLTGWFNSAGLAIDDSDHLHVAWVSEAQELLTAASDGGGFTYPLIWQEPALASSCHVATTPDGVPHFVYLAPTPTGPAPRYTWLPEYVGPPYATVPVAEPGQEVLDPPAHGLKMALSADGAPLVLLVQSAGAPPAPKMSVATLGPGGFAFKELVKPQKDKNPCASTAPTNANETCTGSIQFELVPLAVVVSRGGDARFLYATRHTELTYHAKCLKPQGIETFCTWEQTDSQARGALHIARFGAGTSVIDAELAEGLPHAGNAVLDRKGAIHMAVYDSTIPSHPARYLQIGF